jgi:hypothetical protein
MPQSAHLSVPDFAGRGSLLVMAGTAACCPSGSQDLR